MATTAKQLSKFGENMDEYSTIDPWGRIVDAPVPPPKKTKDKLDTILNSFPTFDNEVKAGAKYRREKESAKILNIKTEIMRLEKLLNEEVKRRVEMNKSMQVWAEEEIIKLNENFDLTLEELDLAAHKKIDEIIVRMDILEDKFDSEKAKIMKEIEERDAELTKLLNEFKISFDLEVEDRSKREANILKNFNKNENEVDKKFHKEKTQKETKYFELKQTLDENISSRQKTDDKFQAVVKEELTELNRMCEKEKVLREQEDDEIIDALQRYTAKMGASLKIINTADL